MPDSPALSTVLAAPILVRLHLVPLDVVQAYQFHARAQLWCRATFISLSVSLALVAALCVVTIQDHLVIAAILAGSLIGGLTFPRAMIRWRIPVVAERIYRQQRSLRTTYDVIVDPDGVKTTSETGSSSTPWSHYRRMREDADIVLLYQSDALFQMIPKRLVTTAQLEATRRWFGAARADCEET